MTYDTPISNRTDEWLREMRELEAEAYDDTCDTCCDVCATEAISEVVNPPSPPQRQPHPRPAREQPMAKGRGPEGQPAGVHGDSLLEAVASFMTLKR